MSATELLKQFNKDKAELDHNAEMFFNSIVEIVCIKLGKSISSYFSYCFESNNDGYVREIVITDGKLRRYATINFIFNKIIIYCTIITTGYMKDVNYDNSLAEDIIDILIYTKRIFVKCELRKK